MRERFEPVTIEQVDYPDWVRSYDCAATLSSRYLPYDEATRYGLEFGLANYRG